MKTSKQTNLVSKKVISSITFLSIFFIAIFSISFISAGYSDCSYGNCKATKLIAPINYTTLNGTSLFTSLNSTQFDNSTGKLNIIESWLRGIITGYNYIITELDPYYFFNPSNYFNYTSFSWLSKGSNQYQESTNQSTIGDGVGLDYSGNYSFDNWVFGDPYLVNDGDWNTFGYSPNIDSGVSQFYANYTQPLKVLSAQLKVKDNCGTRYLDIPSTGLNGIVKIMVVSAGQCTGACASTNNVKYFYWDYAGDGWQDTGVDWVCGDGTNPTDNNLYEEAMIWNVEKADYTLNANDTDTLDGFHASSFITSITNIFDQWLNTTSSVIFNNINITGNLSVKRPYGMFSSTQTQTIAVIGTAYPITFNWTEDNYQVIKQGNSNFSIQQSGDYLIELSAVGSATEDNKHIEMWVQIHNGTAWNNVPRSNTKMEITKQNAETILSVPFILDIHSNEKFRIMWASDSTTTQLLYVTNTSYAPETPSIIMTVSKISETTP